MRLVSNLDKIKRATVSAKSCIYDGGQYVGKWRGHDVFEPTFADNEPRYIGFPQFIFVGNDDVRFTNGDDESRAIMRAFSSNDD